MSAEFDVGQEVAASLDSRQGAWRFIRRYTESWLTPLTDDDGWTEADLEAAEQCLGPRLPPAIREAYALFGRRQDLTSIQDRLLGPDQLEVDTTGKVLVYRVENQSVAVWGCRWPPWPTLIHRW
jgi:cell wall assembly regulator SMI1